MSKERELLKRWLSGEANQIPSHISLLIETQELLAKPENKQEVYAKGYAEAMRQQVYEAFEAGRKSALSNDWDKERDAMSEAWYLPESKQEPVAVVDSVFSLLWINRGHYTEGLKVGDFLYTAPSTREGLTPREGLTEYKKGYAQAELDLKREPLSYERLSQLYALNIPYDPLNFARQVELAHGIGVDDV